ncbi:MAG: hypothetical protein NZ516_02465, partial [Raineya sp.]|nr:hypothetical protein [Raineya sp.]
MAIRKSAVLASVISFFVTIIIPLYQWGFQIPYEILLKSLGVSWFIVLLPQFLPQPTQLQWWRTYSLQSVYLLFFLATLGFLKRYAEWLGWLSWFVAGLGIVFGILTAFLYFKKMPFSFKKVGGYVFLGFLIGSYLLAQAYKFNFCPILLENLSALNVPFGYGDTVYHSACAKMFQTYEVFTTGLDGTPAMNYNVFTHWLNGHLAYFLEIPMYQFYNLSYPIIFFGFWFFAFLELAQRIYLFFCEKKQIQATALPTSL